MARFSDLPQELRDIIWIFAIRPEGPTAHCLSVCWDDEEDKLVGPQWSIGGSIESFDDENSRAYPLLPFAAPRRGRDGSFSWVLGNYSAYMEDSALWTTCRDSRSHMIQRFHPNETNRRTNRERPAGEWLLEAATVTTVLQRDAGERQYFTIEPVKDLIILQTIPGSGISLDPNIDDLHFPSINVLWELMSFGTMLSWRTQSGIHCEPRNLAIEFDPKWLKETDRCIKNFHDTILMEVDTLWFIDDRLQLFPEGERLPRSEFNQPKIFNAMGRRFVEVDECDVEISESDDRSKYEAFDFVNELESIRFLKMVRDEDRVWDSWERESSGCHFKVLACEPL